MSIHGVSLSSDFNFYFLYSEFKNWVILICVEFWKNGLNSRLAIKALSYTILFFHPLEVVSRYRDPQLQVGENKPYLFNLRPNICKFCRLNTHFVHNNCDLTC